MIEDGFISNDFKPEHFKRLIISEYNNISIKFFLLTKDELSKKIIKHYQTLKSDFLQKTG